MRKIDPEKHEEQRARILAAAEKCFVKDGFRGATIANICSEAEMSPGHLYHYFSGKEAIVAAMTQQALEHVARHFDEIMSKPDVVAAFLSEFDRPQGKRRGPDPLLILEVTAEASRNPAIAQIVQHRGQRVQGLIASFLREGQRRSQVDPTITVEPAAAILVNLFDAFKTLPVRDPTFDPVTGITLLKMLVSRFLTPPK